MEATLTHRRPQSAVLSLMWLWVHPSLLAWPTSSSWLVPAALHHPGPLQMNPSKPSHNTRKENKGSGLALYNMSSWNFSLSSHCTGLSTRFTNVGGKSFVSAAFRACSLQLPYLHDHFMEHREVTGWRIRRKWHWQRIHWGQQASSLLCSQNVISHCQ